MTASAEMAAEMEIFRRKGLLDVQRDKRVAAMLENFSRTIRSALGLDRKECRRYAGQFSCKRCTLRLIRNRSTYNALSAGESHT